MSNSRNRDPTRGWSEIFDKHADQDPNDDSYDPEGDEFDEATEFSPMLDSQDSEHPRFGGDADATVVHETFERAVGGEVERRDQTVIDDSHLKKEIEERLAQLDVFDTEDTPLLSEDTLSRPGDRTRRYESAAQATLLDTGKPEGSEVGPTLPGDDNESVDARIRAALNQRSAEPAESSDNYDKALPRVETSEDIEGKPGFEPTVASAKRPIFDDDDATVDSSRGFNPNPDKTAAYVVTPGFEEATMETRAASSASQEFQPIIRTDTASGPREDLDLGLEDDEEELEAYEPANLDEATRAAPIPHELLEELSRPPTAVPRARKKRRSEVEVTPVPAAHPKTNEDTDLDLAAVIGVPARPPSVQEPDPVPPPQPARPSGARDESALRVGMHDILDPASKAKPKGKTKKQPKRGPRDGVSASQLLRLSDTTSNIAKIIPLGLGIFVIVATVIISLSFFETSSKQRHVELNFLAVGTQESPPMRRVQEGGTQLVIETTPPDILVLYGGKILGKTPLNTRLPIEITGPVGVELSSPYFERWLTQAERTITNELRVEAELKLRR